MKRLDGGRMEASETEFRAMLNEQRARLARVREQAATTTIVGGRAALEGLAHALASSVSAIEYTMKRRGWTP